MVFPFKKFDNARYYPKNFDFAKQKKTFQFKNIFAKFKIINFSAGNSILVALAREFENYLLRGKFKIINFLRGKFKTKKKKHFNPKTFCIPKKNSKLVEI